MRMATKKLTAKGLKFEFDAETKRCKLPVLVDVEYDQPEGERAEPTLESVRSHIGEVTVDAFRINESLTLWLDDEGRLKEDPPLANIYVIRDGDLFDFCGTCLLTLDEPAPRDESDPATVARAEAAEEMILKLAVVSRIRPAAPNTEAAAPGFSITPFTIDEPKGVH
jgi:hypothetical protein